MTPQEQLHAVSTAIRKALPRLMEPTENCYLEVDIPNESIITFKSNGTFNWYGEIYISLVNVKLQLHNKIKLSSNRYKILGHDILLTDVLEWLGLLKENNEDLFHCSLNEEIMRIDMDNKGRYEANMFKINISKPHLADQSEELWNFLYDLIKED